MAWRRRELSVEYISHCEVLDYAQQLLSVDLPVGKYSRKVVDEVVSAYLESVIQALGTGRDVQLSPLCMLSAHTTREVRNDKRDQKERKYPFSLQLKVRPLKATKTMIKKAIVMYNDVIEGKMVPKALKW